MIGACPRCGYCPTCGGPWGRWHRPVVLPVPCAPLPLYGAAGAVSQARAALAR